MALPLNRIGKLVGKENLLTDWEDLVCYGFDASRLGSVPEAVVHPSNSHQVSELLRLAYRAGFAVYPRGAGTGMVGSAVPTSGGVVITTTRMNRIIEVRPEDGIAIVQPGVVTGVLQREVARQGLFYPPDPASASFCTIGGNVATGAGGPRAVKYGVTRDYVLGLETVLPEGEIFRAGAGAGKYPRGYDLMRVMIGSEGTLGIFTEIVLKLIPAPEGQRVLAAFFSRINDAADAVGHLIRRSPRPATLEFLDEVTMKVVESHARLGLPVKMEAMLIVEVDGRNEYLDEEARQVAALCRAAGASLIQTARCEEERQALWAARRSISPALGRIKPGKINEDVTVPPSRIPELVRGVHEISRRHRLVIACFGHAGDGNIHTNIMLDKRNQEECARAEQAAEELFRLVLDLSGTLTGEHGVGITKSPYLHWEIGSEGVHSMWRVKRALDPKNIMNPGKMFKPNRAFFLASHGGGRTGFS